MKFEVYLATPFVILNSSIRPILKPVVQAAVDAFVPDWFPPIPKLLDVETFKVLIVVELASNTPSIQKLTTPEDLVTAMWCHAPVEIVDVLVSVVDEVINESVPLVVTFKIHDKAEVWPQSVLVADKFARFTHISIVKSFVPKFRCDN